MSIAVLEQTEKRKEIRFWTPLHEVEASALAQLENTAALPWVFHHVAVMADVHYGVGATVGSVIAMKDAISPAACGVDIGCGMAAIKTSLRASDLPDNLESLRSAIEAAVPVGFNSHVEDADQLVGLGSVGDQALQLFSRFGRLDQSVQHLANRAIHQVGTLGGGNHFIELCLESELCPRCTATGTEPYTDQRCKNNNCNDGFVDPSVWLMLHSGSRNIGKELASIHIEAAKKLAHNADLPDPDLAVFLAGTPEMERYRHDLLWAQEYAWLNRLVMLEICKSVLIKTFPAGISFDAPIACHHNYVSEETHFGEDVIVTRKGAISARKGELGIIPGSMGAKSFIVRGLGNPDSFHSASHGAGRKMSRGAAKRHFTTADLAAQTAGVCCRKDVDIIDEIPAAYKDIETVMSNQSDLVEIVTELKQVLCVKG